MEKKLSIAIDGQLRGKAPLPKLWLRKNRTYILIQERCIGRLRTRLYRKTLI